MSSFFTVNRNPEDVQDYKVSDYITKSGIYDLTILAAIVDVNEKGARTINLYAKHNEQPQMFFQAIRVDNNDGSLNYQADLLNKLLIVTDIDSLSEPVKESLPIGKEGAEKEVMILPELCDVEVTARIQMHYSLYDGRIQEKKIFKAFLRSTDNASAGEIVNDAPVYEEGMSETASYIGKQFTVESKYADNVTYENDLTEEDIQKWIADGRGSKGASKPEPKKPSAGFSGKRFGK